jgi:hypothetical protein
MAPPLPFGLIFGLELCHCMNGIRPFFPTPLVNMSVSSIYALAFTPTLVLASPMPL